MDKINPSFSLSVFLQTPYSSWRHLIARDIHVYPAEYPEEASQDEYENKTSYNESESSDDNWSVETDEVITEEIISTDGAVVWNLNPFKMISD